MVEGLARKVKVLVPATSANLGPGYDCLGIALDLLNDFVVERLPHKPSVIEGHGTCAGMTDPDNLFTRAFAHTFKKAGQYAPAVRVDLYGRIPLSRGLGSSATAIVAGVMAANAFLNYRFSDNDLLEHAAAIEGHPDNVAPALLGGMTAALQTGTATLALQYRPHRNWRVVTLIPTYELSTKAAREAIPEQIPHRDGVFNLARIPFLLDAIVEGDARELAAALEDRLHEPYRKNLVRDFDAIAAAAREAGAPAAYLSGAGPTIAALCIGHETAEAVRNAMVDAARANDPDVNAMIFGPRPEGAEIQILQAD